MELLQVGRQSGPTRWKLLQVIRLDLGDLLGFLDGTAAVERLDHMKYYLGFRVGAAVGSELGSCGRTAWLLVYGAETIVDQ